VSDINTKTSLRPYPARVFTREGMFCPHCRRELENVAETCRGCGFNLNMCQKSFPFGAPPLALIIDPSQLLPAGIEEDLHKPYRKFRKCTPQVDICFCFVRLQVESPLKEFAFWLHNTAPGADHARAWQLLVVGDLTSGRLTLTSGYALEPFLKQELWEAALQELAACFSDEQWKEGLHGFLTEARNLLTTAWQVAEGCRQPNHRPSPARSQDLPEKLELERPEESEIPGSEAFPSDTRQGYLPTSLQRERGSCPEESATP